MPLYFYFLVTLLIELPAVILFFRRQWKRALVTGFLLNLFTWPLLHIFLFETSVPVNLLEFVIALLEGMGYVLLMRCKWWQGILLSFVVNGLSYGAGLLINQ